MPRTQCEYDFFADSYDRYYGAPLGPRLTRQRGFNRISQVNFEPRVEAMNSQAHKHLSECVRDGGQYMGIDIVRMFAGTLPNDKKCDFDTLDSLRRATVEDAFGLCVPSSCGERDTRDEILPRVLPNYFFSTRQYISAVNLMVRRKDIRIDFVIAGFPKCGTTSMAYALHASVPIDMACDVEEETYSECERCVFSWDPPFAFLWKLSEVKDFNNAFRKKVPGVVRGVKDSRALEKDESIRRLASIDGIKVVVVIRHPVRGYISHYDSVGCRAMISFEDFVASNMTDCVPGRNWELWSSRIARLLEMVPAERVLVLTIDEASTDNGFRRLVEFVLGRRDVGILPNGTKPWQQRRNVGVGQDDGVSALEQVCQSQELQNVLTDRFHDEVRELQRYLAMFGSRTELPFACKPR